MIFANLAPIQLRFFTFFWPVGSLCIWCYMKSYFMREFTLPHPREDVFQWLTIVGAVHLMWHEVLLSFCFLICHYEWIHTSSPWRTRFLVASNRPPTWDRMWLFKVVAPVKDREQYPHLKGFLLTWMTACARNSQTLLKWAGQWPHW